MHCPNCQHNGSQHYVGERFNPFTLTHEGNWRCNTCLCEYTEKDSGRIVITKAGLTSSQVREERHRLAIESIIARGEKEFEKRKAEMKSQLPIH